MKLTTTDTLEIESIKGELLVNYSWEMIDGERDNVECNYVQVGVAGSYVTIWAAGKKIEGALSDAAIEHIMDNVEFNCFND